MPWCEPCGRYLTPNSVLTDGSCPSCGTEVETAPDIGDPAAGAAGVAPSSYVGQKVPWHFWVVVALAAIYLGWRAIQGVLLLF